MVTKSFYRPLTQPVAGFTLFALVAVACPSPTWSQPQQNVNQAAPAPTATLQLEQQVTDYTLGGGDRIRINVFDVPEYSGEYQVPPGGSLYLPLIGGVSVRGLTQAQAAETIGARYARFLKRPLVTVSLTSPRPINVVIAGEVNQAGSYTVGLQGGAGDNPGVQYPTVLGALTLANGVTLAADVRQVQLRRNRGLGAGEQVITLDLTQLVQSGGLSQDITLRDGDTVFVPTATSVNMAEARSFATTSFAAPITQPRTVTVVGAVFRPGSYVVIGGAAGTTAAATTDGGGDAASAGGGLPTVTRAIQLAGGIKPTADIRNINIRRSTKAGPEQNVRVDLWRLLNAGDVNQDTLVQNGDTIVIPTATDTNPAEATALAEANFSPATIRVNVVGEVKNPGIVALKPNTTLNQSIMSAGGFADSRARRSTVELIRLNPDGTVTKRKVKLNMAQGINEETNPMLRDNDIVVINRNGLAEIGDTLGTVFAPFLSVFSVVNLFR